MAQEQQIAPMTPHQAPSAEAAPSPVATTRGPDVVCARFGGAAPVAVQVCGRLITIPPEASGSVSLLSRHLAAQLRISGHSALQFQDVAGRPIKGDLELSAAIREERVPLQASMTVMALREIEQKKSEVETKKEELAQFQWQVIVDQIAALAEQVNSISPTIQSVRGDCQMAIDQARADLAMRSERMEEAVSRESKEREVGFKEMETKIDKLLQAVCAERSARDVVSHQLSAQLEAVTMNVESDRSLRAQERAEMQRLYEAVKHQVDAEQARNEEQWNWHLQTAKRLDASLEERVSAATAQQMRITELEAGADRLRASVASVESSVATTQRTMQELMTNRQEELAKLVRNEIVGRENHISRFAKELETSWQSLEARLTRVKEEAAMSSSTVAERARVLEMRCAQIEHEMSTHMSSQAEQNHRFSEKTAAVASTVDALEMNLKSSDVLTQTTVSRVDDITQRLCLVEDDCQSKARADYWRPQMEALQRADSKFEAKLASMERDMLQRLQQEASNRDGLKAQLQDSLKSCMDKIIAGRPAPEKGRFADAAASPAVASRAAASPQLEDCGSGMMTPRCTFSMTTGSAFTSNPSSLGFSSAQLQAVGPAAGDKTGKVVSPVRMLVRSPDVSPQTPRTAGQPNLRMITPRRS